MRYPDRAQPTTAARLTVVVSSAGDRSHAEVQLIGELDRSEATHLGETLDRLCDSGFARISVDLAGLQFLDCAGLTVFLHAHARSREGGAAVVLTRPARMATRILQVTGLDGVLAVHAERTSNRASISSPDPAGFPVHLLKDDAGR